MKALLRGVLAFGPRLVPTPVEPRRLLDEHYQFIATCCEKATGLARARFNPVADPGEVDHETNQLFTRVVDPACQVTRRPSFRHVFSRNPGSYLDAS